MIKFLIFFVLIFIILASGLYIANKINFENVLNDNSSSINILKKSNISKPINTPNDIEKSKIKNIQNSIQKVTSKYPDIQFGISFIDVKSGEKTDINGTTLFDGASTTKLLIACLLLYQTEQGNYDLNEVVNGQTLNQLLKEMINLSDNNAWVEIMNFIGYQYQTPYAESIGINSYDYINNKIDSNDMALLLYKLYTGKILNSYDTQLLLSYMQNTNNENLIPGAETTGVITYHKYGMYTENLHDAAIVDNGNNSYVIAIYTYDKSGIFTYEQKVKIFHNIIDAIEKADKN